MIFGYEELKGYVIEDFERFYNMNFDEKQIYPAVLDEYEYAKNFSRVENICIHVVLALTYVKNDWNCKRIVDKLKMLMSDEAEDELKIDLGNEYTNFNKDYSAIMENICKECYEKGIEYIDKSFI